MKWVDKGKEGQDLKRRRKKPIEKTPIYRGIAWFAEEVNTEIQSQRDSWGANKKIYCWSGIQIRE